MAISKSVPLRPKREAEDIQLQQPLEEMLLVFLSGKVSTGEV